MNVPFKLGMVLGLGAGMVGAALLIDHMVPHTMNKVMQSGQKMAKNCAQSLCPDCNC